MFGHVLCLIYESLGTGQIWSMTTFNLRPWWRRLLISSSDSWWWKENIHGQSPASKFPNSKHKSMFEHIYSFFISYYLAGSKPCKATPRTFSKQGPRNVSTFPCFLLLAQTKSINYSYILLCILLPSISENPMLHHIAVYPTFSGHLWGK